MNATDVKTELDFQVYLTEKWEEILQSRAQANDATWIYEARFNDYFATEEEARFYWALYNFALHGPDAPVPPFPRPSDPMNKIDQRLTKIEARLAVFARTGQDLPQKGRAIMPQKGVDM